MVLVAACAAPIGRVFQTSLPTPDQDPLPITLTDETGLVTGLGAANYDPQATLAMVADDPTTPNALIVSWLGGGCDKDAAIIFRRSPSGSGYDLQVASTPKLGLGCVAVGIGRGLRITTSEPVSVDTIHVSGGG